MSTWRTVKTKPMCSRKQTRTQTRQEHQPTDQTEVMTVPPPPSRNTTWHTQEGLTLVPTEVLDQSLIQSVPGRCADGSPRSESDPECPGPVSNSSLPNRNPPSPPETGNTDHGV